MSLVTSVEAIYKRPLTTGEVQQLSDFQRQFEVADDDPVIVVLAMLAHAQVSLDAAPKLLQQKVDETIELHRIALREQAVIVAKDLIGDVAKQLVIQGKGDRRLLQWCIASAVAGAIGFGTLLLLSLKVSRYF